MEQGFKGSKQELFVSATKLLGKVMLHEVGHLFNLKHCVYFNCIMNGAKDYEESLNSWFEFCPVCLRKLNINLEFDVKERFKNIIEGLTKLSTNLYKKEINWFKRRSENIEKIENLK